MPAATRRVCHDMARDRLPAQRQMPRALLRQCMFRAMMRASAMLMLLQERLMRAMRYAFAATTSRFRVCRMSLFSLFMAKIAVPYNTAPDVYRRKRFSACHDVTVVDAAIFFATP